MRLFITQAAAIAAGNEAINAGKAVSGKVRHTWVRNADRSSDQGWIVVLHNRLGVELGVL